METFPQPHFEPTPVLKVEQNQGIVLDTTENFSELHGNEDMERIYDWYASAIMRRDREPLSEERFLAHFFENGSTEPSYMYGNMEKGFLLGMTKNEIFVPTHFAPSSLRNGYELLKSLAESKDLPTVMAVTEDLKDTIKKMDGWHTFNTKILAYFNSDLIEKTIVYNDCPGLKRKMFGLIKEYFSETSSLTQNNENRGGGRRGSGRGSRV